MGATWLRNENVWTGHRSRKSVCYNLSCADVVCVAIVVWFASIFCLLKDINGLTPECALAAANSTVNNDQVHAFKIAAMHHRGWRANS